MKIINKATLALLAMLSCATLAAAQTKCILLENFTTSSGIYDPAAETRLTEAVANYTGCTIVRVSHHCGYYTDNLTDTASEALTELYNSGSTFVPAAMIDRSHDIALMSTYSSQAATGAAFNPGYPYELRRLFDSALAQPVLVEFDTLAINYDRTTRMLGIHISGTLSRMVSADSLRLTVYIVEDSIVMMQSGAGGANNYLHHNVMRHCLTNAWGDSDAVVSDTSFAKTFTYPLPNHYRADRCRIVALMAMHDPTNVNNRKVLNCRQSGNLTTGLDVPFHLTLSVNDTTMGRAAVTESQYYINSSVGVEAFANIGFHFEQWDDGNTENPRTVVLNSDTSLTAHFAPGCVISAQSEDTTAGRVIGGGIYLYGDTAILTAVASEHYHFVSWNDGDTTNPRTVNIAGNASYTASFSIDYHTVTLYSNNIHYGFAYGGTTTRYGDTCEVTATCYPGYQFVRWSNGVTDNPYKINVLSDTCLTAFFAVADTQLFELTVASADPTMGTVAGGGPVADGDSALILANPFAGYRFDRWQDGDTTNPRVVTVTSDTTFIAYFVALDDVVDVYSDNISISADCGRIVICGAKADVLVYDILGRIMATHPFGCGNMVSVTVPESGIYIVKVGNLPARKIIVVR